MSRLMMLTPCAKDDEIPGPCRLVLRIRICTREMMTRNVSRTGSHHSCVLTE